MHRTRDAVQLDSTVPDGAALHARQTNDDVLGVVGLQLKEVTVIDDLVDDILHVVRHVGIARHNAVQRQIGAGARVVGGARGHTVAVVQRQEVKELARASQGLHIVVERGVRHTGFRGVRAGATLDPPHNEQATMSGHRVGPIAGTVQRRRVENSPADPNPSHTRPMQAKVPTPIPVQPRTSSSAVTCSWVTVFTTSGPVTNKYEVSRTIMVKSVMAGLYTAPPVASLPRAHAPAT